MRLIDADELPKVKFHALPYTHIVPSDLKGLQTEAYERGWNDAIDAIVENAETADVVERKQGRWEYVDYGGFGNWHCTACRKIAIVNGNENYCPNCGADMRGGDTDA